MVASVRCPECGADIPADAPEGLCPRCLAGLATGTPTKIDVSDAADPRRYLDVAPPILRTGEEDDPNKGRK